MCFGLVKGDSHERIGRSNQARRLALRGDADSLEIRAVLAVDPLDGPDPLGLETAGRIAAFLGRVVAVSRPFGSVGDRPTAEAEARAGIPLSFLDAASIPNEFRGYVSVATSRGLIQSDTLFRPQGVLTRAELAHAIAVIERRAIE